mgnify:CR=1 FL=1
MLTMGDYADQMINGEVCRLCGAPFEEPQGEPVECSDCKDSRKAKKQKNKEWSTNHLKEIGIEFTSHNFGSHLRVKRPAGVIDFWPSTGKYKRPNGTYGRGIQNMLKDSEAKK